jgi:hypothetical protein
MNDRSFSGDIRKPKVINVSQIPVEITDRKASRLKIANELLLNMMCSDITDRNIATSNVKRYIGIEDISTLMIKDVRSIIGEENAISRAVVVSVEGRVKRRLKRL